MDLFIEAHPSCINVANDSGMTPLFIAMTHVGNTGFSVILHLLRLCPESAHHMDERHQLPLHVALKQHASFEVIRALVDANPHGVRHI
jgi:hypothetical protein